MQNICGSVVFVSFQNSEHVYVNKQYTCTCTQKQFFYLPWVDGVTKSKTATFFWSWEAIKKSSFTFSYQFFSSWQHSQFNISNTMTNSWFFIIFLERDYMYVPVACVVFLSQSIRLIISYIIGYTSNMHICKDLNPASFDHLSKSAPIINKKSKKKKADL